MADTYDEQIAALVDHRMDDYTRIVWNDPTAPDGCWEEWLKDHDYEKRADVARMHHWIAWGISLTDGALFTRLPKCPFCPVQLAKDGGVLAAKVRDLLGVPFDTDRFWQTDGDFSRAALEEIARRQRAARAYTDVHQSWMGDDDA